MKKCYSLLRYFLLITGCAQQTFTVQNKPAAVAPKKPSPIISSFLELGRRKLSMQPKFVAAQKIFVKTETQQTFVNGLLGFTLVFILRWKRVCIAHNNYMGAHRYGQLCLHCSLIYFWVPSSCFCMVVKPLSEGEIIPFSGVCQSGGGCIIPPEAANGFTH